MGIVCQHGSWDLPGTSCREFVNPEVLDKTPQALKYHFHSQTDYQKYWKGNNVSSQQLCKIIFHTYLACLVNQSLPLFLLWYKPCFHLMHLYQLELPQLLNSSWKAPQLPQWILDAMSWLYKAGMCNVKFALMFWNVFQGIVSLSISCPRKCLPLQ